MRLLALVVLGPLACALPSRPGPAALTRPCTAAAEADATWPLVVDTLGGFSLRLPPGYERKAQQGVDSYVGRWQRGASQVSFDLGWYSNPLSSARELGYEKSDESYTCNMQLTGRTVRFLTVRQGGQYIVAAHWPARRGTVKLTFKAETADPAELGQLLAALRSVRFVPRSAAG